MKMMPPDVISHDNQLQHLSEPSIFMLDVFRTADHAGQIFIPHRRTALLIGRPLLIFYFLSGFLSTDNVLSGFGNRVALWSVLMVDR